MPIGKRVAQFEKGKDSSGRSIHFVETWSDEKTHVWIQISVCLAHRTDIVY